MYISAKHYCGSTVYVYDEAADSVTRVTVKAIHVIDTKETTTVSYEVARHNGETCMVAEEVVCGSSSAAFDVPSIRAWHAKTAADALTKAAEGVEA